MIDIAVYDLWHQFWVSEAAYLSCLASLSRDSALCPAGMRFLRYLATRLYDCLKIFSTSSSSSSNDISSAFSFASGSVRTSTYDSSFVDSAISVLGIGSSTMRVLGSLIFGSRYVSISNSSGTASKPVDS